MYYKYAREIIRSGDCGLLKRPGSAIAEKGRSNKSHAMMMVWRHSDQSTLSVAESRELCGARVISLSSQVERFPGAIDVYTPNDDCPKILRERAATIAYNWAGHAYNYPNILKIWLAHETWLRSLAGAAILVAEKCGLNLPRINFDFTDLTPTKWDEAKICSQLYVWSYRWAKHELFFQLDERARNWDPVPELGDRWVEPGDLARSGSLNRIAEGLVK
jgi:hypothetical protein